MGSKILLQENPPVLNWRCWLSQVYMYNGHKTCVCVFLFGVVVYRDVLEPAKSESDRIQILCFKSVGFELGFRGPIH